MNTTASASESATQPREYSVRDQKETIMRPATPRVTARMIRRNSSAGVYRNASYRWKAANTQTMATAVPNSRSAKSTPGTTSPNMIQ